MATVTRVVGTIGFVCKGEYDSATTYNSLNVVTYDNSLYLAIRDNFSNILPTDIDYWTLLIRGFESSSFYTKQDVDDNFYKKTYVDENFYNKNSVDSAFYKKSEINTNFYDKTSTDNKFYNKTEIDGKIKTYTLTYENSVLKLTDNNGNEQPVVITGGGGSGSTTVSSVIVAPTLTSGTEIATIIVDDVPTKIYAPTINDISGYFGIREFQNIFAEVFISEQILQRLGYNTMQEVVNYIPYSCSSKYYSNGRPTIKSAIKQQKTITVNKITDRDNFYENLPNNISDEIYDVVGRIELEIAFILVKDNGYLKDMNSFQIPAVSKDYFKSTIISAMKANYKRMEDTVKSFENGDRLYALIASPLIISSNIYNAETLDEIQNVVSSSDNTMFIYSLLSYERFMNYAESVTQNGIVVRTPLESDSYNISYLDIYVWRKTLFASSGGSDYQTLSAGSVDFKTLKTKCFCFLQSDNDLDYIHAEMMTIDKMNDDETEMFIERY